MIWRSISYSLILLLAAALVVNLVQATYQQHHPLNKLKAAVELRLGLKQEQPLAPVPETNAIRTGKAETKVLAPRKSKAQYTIAATPEQRFVGTFYDISFDTTPDIQVANALKQFLANKLRFGIEQRLTDDIYLIYTDYSRYSDKHLTVFVGYRVNGFDTQGHVFKSLTIPSQQYATFAATGDLYSAIPETWSVITKSHIRRSFYYDMEVYPPESLINALSTSYIKVSVKK